MALTETPPPAAGFRAPDFRLEDPSGRTWNLADVRGPAGTVVAFICNHCPYVRATVEAFVDDARRLAEAGVGIVAIMPNDWERHPDDAPPRMAEFARRHGFGFPYLIDASQSVARAYGAVCTPDYFGFDAADGLVYRGRLDATTPGRPADPSAARDLLTAMRMVAAGLPVTLEQRPSVGCSIKWRPAPD